MFSSRRLIAYINQTSIFLCLKKVDCFFWFVQIWLPFSIISMSLTDAEMHTYCCYWHISLPTIYQWYVFEHVLLVSLSVSHLYLLLSFSQSDVCVCLITKKNTNPSVSSLFVVIEFAIWNIICEWSFICVIFRRNDCEWNERMSRYKRIFMA